MKKVKAFWQKVVGGVKKAGSKVALMAAMPIMPLTAEGTTSVDLSSTVESIKGMLGDFSVANLIIIVGAALGLCVALILFWFAFRFIFRKVSKALKRGSF